MSVIGLLLLGVVLGAASVQIIRANSPELLEKIEAGAKSLVDKLGWSKPADKKQDE